MRNVSWEEPKKIRCPVCNTDMEFREYDFDDDLTLEFECPRCGLTTALYFNRNQIVKTILSKIGYWEEEVKPEKGEEGEAEG